MIKILDNSKKLTFKLIHVHILYEVFLFKVKWHPADLRARKTRREVEQNGDQSRIKLRCGILLRPHVY